LKVNKSTRLDFPDGDEKPQQVDIGVSDLIGFAADGAAFERFRKHQPGLLVEAKLFPKGWVGHTWEYVARQQLKDVAVDGQKLARHLRLGRCAVAALLLVDDEDYFEHNRGGIEWPDGVELLVCSPAELQRRGVAVSAA
jgi:hypothetical protein